jgi:tetrahydromethanopterin S-methyltransferase subunit G
LAVATDVLCDNTVPQVLADMTIDRLRKVRLTESRKKLAFVYAETFQRLRK